MTDIERLLVANDEAQAAFRAMLKAGTMADPAAAEVLAYERSERVIDAILEGIQKQARVGRMMDDLDGFTGDHHVYPAGPGR